MEPSDSSQFYLFKEYKLDYQWHLHYQFSFFLSWTIHPSTKKDLLPSCFSHFCLLLNSNINNSPTKKKTAKKICGIFVKQKQLNYVTQILLPTLKIIKNKVIKEIFYHRILLEALHVNNRFVLSSMIMIS